MKKYLFYGWTAVALVALLVLSPLARAPRAKGVEASPNSYAEAEGLTPIAAAATAQEEPRYEFLWSLVGKSREQVLGFLKEKPVYIDKNGFAFKETGIRVWFDDSFRNAATRVVILSDDIDLNGARVGKRLTDFADAFGNIVWENGEEAHFIYEDYILVVRYFQPGRTVVNATIMDKDYYQGQYLPSLPL